MKQLFVHVGVNDQLFGWHVVFPSMIPVQTFQVRLCGIPTLCITTSHETILIVLFTTNVHTSRCVLYIGTHYGVPDL